MNMNWEEDRKRGQGMREGEYHCGLAQRLKVASGGTTYRNPSESARTTTRLLRAVH